MVGRRVLARDAAAHGRWLARLFGECEVEGIHAVPDYGVVANLDCGPERRLDVEVGPGLLDEVQLTQFALGAIGPLTRAEE